MTLSGNIEEIYMGVLDITQYGLVSAHEFPGTARFKSALQEMVVRAHVAVFSHRYFINLAHFECLPRRDGVS